MTYGDKIRSMSDKELAHFLGCCVITDDEYEPMFICGIGHFTWIDELAHKLGEKIMESEE